MSKKIESLLMMSFRALKTLRQREDCVIIATQNVVLLEESITLLAEFTRHTLITLSSCDRLGINLEFTLRKTSGCIKLIFHKKKVCDYTCIFIYNDKIVQSFSDSRQASFDNILNLTYLQIALIDCLPELVTYIHNGLSKKWKNLSSLVRIMLKYATNIQEFVIDVRTSPHMRLDKTHNVWTHHYGKYICIDTSS